MKVIRAEAMGFCFGVRDALQIAETLDHPEQVTIHGELVHNEAVLVQLDARGFRQAAEDDRDAVPETPAVLITAHGVSQRERARLEAAGKRLIDATCPLVRRAQEAARALAAEGRLVIVIGRKGHVEVAGLVGDLDESVIVSAEADIVDWQREGLGIVCQTTTPPGTAEQLRALIVERNPQADIRYAATVCQPTIDRQEAVERLIPQVEAMVVVGGRNSHNTRRLADLCRERGLPAYHVQSADDLCADWFRDCRVVGLTAGTSTRDEDIDAVARALESLDTVEPPTEGPLSSWEWCVAFRRNAGRLLEIPWDRVTVTDTERTAIGRSVAIFQRGESGEGRHLLRCADRYAEQSGDAEYPAALRLFIAEEQRHAADLGTFLDRAGLPRLERTWTDGLFRWLRHLAGLELSVSVLLTAEVIAMTYYAALRKATRCPALRTLCEQILRDEVTHLRFQGERLGLLRRGNPGWLVRVKQRLQRVLYGGTSLVVWCTHRGVFRAAGVRFADYRRQTRREYARAERWMTPTGAESKLLAAVEQ